MLKCFCEIRIEMVSLFEICQDVLLFGHVKLFKKFQKKHKLLILADNFLHPLAHLFKQRVTCAFFSSIGKMFSYKQVFMTKVKCGAITD